jgi:hypothetical protein
LYEMDIKRTKLNIREQSFTVEFQREFYASENTLKALSSELLTALIGLLERFFLRLVFQNP